MGEPPAGVSVVALADAVRERYGLAVSSVVFLPLGHDPAAWVFRVETARGPYFLKLCSRIRHEAGLRVPRSLQQQGSRRVVAPLATLAGDLWTAVSGYAMVLYPFVDGPNAKAHGLTAAQWIVYGRAVREIHETPLPPSLRGVVASESYLPTGADLTRSLDEQLGDAASGRTFADPAHVALAQLWRPRREQIRALVAQAEALGHALAQTAPPLVLCHADIHTANVLVDPDGDLWIVDWDETLLAPRERDLMFAVGGISRTMVTPEQSDRFLRGYNQGCALIVPDPLALAYYRYAWAVSDISAYGETVLRRDDLSVSLRLGEVEAFASLFAPGNIVEIALASDPHG
ncbi:MAG: aminoglycoside phosphotransferase family protein [Chloroflexi bacterium]|nr:aminoglycoside phosphotransferase family protein [Chloroflexota bacterium]